MLRVGRLAVLLQCHFRCEVKNAEWDATVCCARATSATSIREVTSLSLIRMTVRWTIAECAVAYT